MPCECTSCHSIGQSDMLSFMLYVLYHNFLRRRKRKQTKKETEQHYSPFCSKGKAGPVSKSLDGSFWCEEFKVRHCNVETAMTIIELIVIVIVIPLRNRAKRHHNLYGRTEVYDQPKQPYSKRVEMGNLAEEGVVKHAKQPKSHSGQKSKCC